MGQFFTYDHEYQRLEFWDTCLESRKRLRRFRDEVEEVEQETQEETGRDYSRWSPWPVMTIGQKVEGKLRMQQRCRRRLGTWTADAVAGKSLRLPKEGTHV